MRYGSVCSGIEAATSAWHSLGWTPVFFSEIEPFPSAVLQHHYPGVPNYGDMTKFKEWPDATINVLVGGTPCQSFSVAGLRKGLDDPRGNLMLTYIAIAQRYRPEWVVWENVPGVLSSNGGRDFACLLRGLEECGYGLAYRILDAQYFGVAQRRRRVFVVGCTGGWQRSAAVLFERHSLSGHPAPSREKGQRVAPTVTNGPPFSRTGNERVECEAMVTTYGIDGEQNCSTELMGTLRSHQTGGYEGARVAVCASGNTVKGFDQQRTGVYGDNDIASTCAARDYKDATDLVAVCASDLGDLAPTVTSKWMKLSGGPAGSISEMGNSVLIPPAVAFKPGQSEAAGGIFLTEEFSPTLQSANNGSTAVPAVAFSAGNSKDSRSIAFSEEHTPPLRAGASGTNMTPTIMSSMQVRRLTPVECERLQGFPDNHTRIPWRNKPAEDCPDGPRYKALGNSMAVPVMHWIGKRIQEVDGE